VSRFALIAICLLGALPLIAAEDSGCETETGTNGPGVKEKHKSAKRRHRATVKRQKVQRARRARQAQRRREAAAAPPKNCDPGYSPCIPPPPPDLSCDDTGPVTVKGLDSHGLDADGDGAACEEE
jgi:hypothetical protein